MTKKESIITTLINDGGKATFARVIAEVEEKVLKTNNPLKNEKITKLVDYTMLLNANYKNLVNNALKREGKEANFEPKQNWFTKLNDSFNGSIVAKISDVNCKYLLFACNFSKNLGYYVNGKEATEEEIAIIKQFKQKSTKPTNQNLDESIIIRTIKLEGIRAIKCGESVVF